MQLVYLKLWWLCIRATKYLVITNISLHLQEKLSWLDLLLKCFSALHERKFVKKTPYSMHMFSN